KVATHREILSSISAARPDLGDGDARRRPERGRTSPEIGGGRGSSSHLRVGRPRPYPPTMSNRRRLRLPFRISISLAFVLITAPLILAIIGTLYLRNAQLARDLATEIMNRATTEIMDRTEALLNPLARVVDATATLGKIDPGLLRRPE